VERSRLADRLSPLAGDIAPPQPDVTSLPDPGPRPRRSAIVTGAAGLFAVYLVWQATQFGGVVHSTLIGDAFFIPMDLLVLFSTIAASSLRGLGFDPKTGYPRDLVWLVG
jgi:hypothetical protein